MAKAERYKGMKEGDGVRRPISAEASELAKAFVASSAPRSRFADAGWDRYSPDRYKPPSWDDVKSTPDSARRAVLHCVEAVCAEWAGRGLTCEWGLKRASTGKSYPYALEILAQIMGRIRDPKGTNVQRVKNDKGETIWLSAYRFSEEWLALEAYRECLRQKISEPLAGISAVSSEEPESEALSTRKEPERAKERIASPRPRAPKKL